MQKKYDVIENLSDRTSQCGTPDLFYNLKHLASQYWEKALLRIKTDNGCVRLDVVEEHTTRFKDLEPGDKFEINIDEYGGCVYVKIKPAILCEKQSDGTDYKCQVNTVVLSAPWPGAGTHRYFDDNLGVKKL